MFEGSDFQEGIEEAVDIFFQRGIYFGPEFGEDAVQDGLTSGLADAHELHGSGGARDDGLESEGARRVLNRDVAELDGGDYEMVGTWIGLSKRGDKLGIVQLAKKIQPLGTDAAAGIPQLGSDPPRIQILINFAEGFRIVCGRRFMGFLEKW